MTDLFKRYNFCSFLMFNISSMQYNNWIKIFQNITFIIVPKKGLITSMFNFYTNIFVISLI